jgi:hypothetical protein
MRRILDIYKEYKITPGLQMHQLRVAAVAAQICDSIDAVVDRKFLITASILHDMGNIVKFDLTQTQSIFGSPDTEIYNLQKTQNEFIKKYGVDEHEATANILREIGLPEKIIQLTSRISFLNVCVDKDKDDWVLKILQYADLRVGPMGVLSFKERTDEGKKRYANRSTLSEEERNKLLACGRELEEQIFSKCKIKPEDINDESVKPLIEELRNFEI